MNPSTDLARSLVDELLSGGVRHAVLAPGSRSAPLALALFDASAAGLLRLHVRIDERSAGFLALGLAKSSGLPVPVVTTSGTAVANLHPAMLEAHHASVPLLALTADRPASMRGTWANQTTNQVGIFGGAAEFFVDVAPDVADIRGLVRQALAVDGTVHLNVQFADPLLPKRVPSEFDGGWLGRGGKACHAMRSSSAFRTQTEPAYELQIGPRTVVVAGDDAGPAARVLAEQAGWPLLAEPSSGARTGAAAIRTYRLLLEHHELAAQIERALVFGHPTLSRPVDRLLRTVDELVVVTSRPDWADPWKRASTVVPEVTASGRDDVAWRDAWTSADHTLSKQLDELVANEPSLTPHEVAGVVSAAVPPRGLLVVGSSNPVRDLDLMAAPYPVGEKRKVLANRGLAGIDGTVSTALGAALGRDSSRAFALMGDLTFLHDTNGLVIGPDDVRPDITIVVVNDDGGSIFATLEQGAPEFAESFGRVFGTPHGMDLAALCAASGTSHRLVTSRDALEDALARLADGIEVIEVPVDGGARRGLDQRIRSLR